MGKMVSEMNVMLYPKIKGIKTALMKPSPCPPLKSQVQMEILVWEHFDSM